MESKLYNYLVSCWTMNPTFTQAQLEQAVTKGYITQDEEVQIEAMKKAV